MSTNNSETPKRPCYPDFMGPAQDHHYAIALDKYCDALEQQIRELQARLFHVFHHDGPRAMPGDTFSKWCDSIDAIYRQQPEDKP